MDSQQVASQMHGDMHVDRDSVENLIATLGWMADKWITGQNKAAWECGTELNKQLDWFKRNTPYGDSYKGTRIQELEDAIKEYLAASMDEPMIPTEGRKQMARQRLADSVRGY